MSASGYRQSPFSPAVDECINSFLKHALLIANDNLRSPQINQASESIITIDYTAVKVIKVAGGESASIQLDDRSKLRGQYREHRQNHPLRLIAATPESFDYPQSLAGLFTTLTRT